MDIHFRRTFFILFFIFIRTAVFPSSLIISDNTFDFGLVVQGQQVSGMFCIISSDFTRVQLQSGCDCLTLSQTECHLSPQIPFEIRWTLDTDDYDGFIKKEIILNSPSDSLVYCIQGTVTNNGIKRRGKTTDDRKNYSFTDDISLIGIPDTLGFFSYHSCKNCAKTAKKLSHFAAVCGYTMYYYDLEDPINKQNLYNMTEKFGTMPALPFVIIGDSHYFGTKQINSLLTHSDAAYNGDKQSKTGKLSIAAIIVSGLLDGINPCAFTVIILLISYLTLQLRDRRSVLITGMIYTFSVFITYFAVGLGLLEFLRRLSAFAAIALILRWSVTIVLLILAVLSLADFILIMSGHKDEMLLKLPHSLQNIIRRNIRHHTKNYKIFGGALMLGMLVSIFELACTGQVYFPIIGYMVSTTDQRSFGILLLLIYNIGFILPLIIVFTLVYAGVSSKHLGDFFGRHIALVKIMFCLLFILFAIINIL